MGPCCHNSTLQISVLAGSSPVLACAGTASLSCSCHGQAIASQEESTATTQMPTCCDEVAYDLGVSLLAGKVQRVHIVLCCQLDVAVVRQQQLDGILC